MEEKVIGDSHVRELKSQGLASGQKPGVALWADIRWSPQ